MKEKKEIFNQISKKIGYEEDELSIDVSILRELSSEDLGEINSMLDKKKEEKRKENLEFIESIYLNTKKDEL